MPLTFSNTLVVAVLDVDDPSEFWQVNVKDFWPEEFWVITSSPDSDLTPDQSPDASQEVAFVVDQLIVTSSPKYIWGLETEIEIEADGTDGVEGSPPPPPPPPQLASRRDAVKNIGNLCFILFIFYVTLL